MRLAPCWLIFLSLALVGATQSGCAPAVDPIRHEAYIWQLQWNGSVREAVLSNAHAVEGWRVLAGVAGRDGSVRPSRPDFEALRVGGRKPILVFRVPSVLGTEHHRRVASEIRAAVDAWPDDLVGGIEIDHDSPTSRLLSYRDFLRTLRKEIPGRALSITLLPTWITSSEVVDLIAEADSTVLQLHAVSHPGNGLLDMRLAEQWAAKMDAVSHRPFSVALPTYGSRVTWESAGKISAVQSEVEIFEVGQQSTELFASPYEVSQFVSRLKGGRHRHLQGIVWFRLPTSQDKRTWSAETWREVMAGTGREPTVSLSLRSAEAEGTLFDLVLRNEGSIDAIPPQEVQVPTHCPMAEGAGGYRLRLEKDGLVLVGAPGRPMRAGSMRSIGWARCVPSERS